MGKYFESGGKLGYDIEINKCGIKNIRHMDMMVMSSVTVHITREIYVHRGPNSTRRSYFMFEFKSPNYTFFHVL